MKTPLELLEEIRKDFVDKHDGDPTINRVCKTFINEFKSREKQLMKRPEIKDYFHEKTDLETVHSEYTKISHLFSYANALDMYIDYLEEQLEKKQ